MVTSFDSNLLINHRHRYNFYYFESLTLSLVLPSWKTQKRVLFVVIYHPPGSWSVYLFKCSAQTKISIVGDFNIHVYAKNYSLDMAFNLLLDSVGFFQNVNETTLITL